MNKKILTFVVAMSMTTSVYAAEAPRMSGLDHVLGQIADIRSKFSDDKFLLMSDIQSHIDGIISACNSMFSDNAFKEPSFTVKLPDMDVFTPVVKIPTAPDTIAPTPAPVIPEDDEQYSSEVMKVAELANQNRADAGLADLGIDSTLMRIAQAKAEDMAATNVLSHESEKYGDMRSLYKYFGAHFSTYGENIACGQDSPEEVIESWMNSSGHRANILNSAYTKIGVGRAVSASGRIYWVQEFGG